MSVSPLVKNAIIAFQHFRSRRGSQKNPLGVLVTFSGSPTDSPIHTGALSELRPCPPDTKNPLGADGLYRSTPRGPRDKHKKSRRDPTTEIKYSRKSGRIYTHQRWRPLSYTRRPKKPLDDVSTKKYSGGSRLYTSPYKTATAFWRGRLYTQTRSERVRARPSRYRGRLYDADIVT